MKYLFTYAYKGKNQGKPENGEGSMEMTVHGTDRITPKIIESAIEITKQNLNACGIQVDKLAPMGWFKYDEDGIDTLEQEPILDKIIAEIKEWYWQADKQALAKDPCVVDAMIDLFIRTIDKYKAESEEA